MGRTERLLRDVRDQGWSRADVADLSHMKEGCCQASLAAVEEMVDEICLNSDALKEYGD
jgi:hypothetical protein